MPPPKEAARGPDLCCHPWKLLRILTCCNRTQRAPPASGAALQRASAGMPCVQGRGAAERTHGCSRPQIFCCSTQKGDTCPGQRFSGRALGLPRARTPEMMRRPAAWAQWTLTGLHYSMSRVKPGREGARACRTAFALTGAAALDGGEVLGREAEQLGVRDVIEAQHLQRDVGRAGANGHHLVQHNLRAPAARVAACSEGAALAG